MQLYFYFSSTKNLYIGTNIRNIQRKVSEDEICAIFSYFWHYYYYYYFCWFRLYKYYTDEVEEGKKNYIFWLEHSHL